VNTQLKCGIIIYTITFHGKEVKKSSKKGDLVIWGYYRGFFGFRFQGCFIFRFSVSRGLIWRFSVLKILENFLIFCFSVLGLFILRFSVSRPPPIGPSHMTKWEINISDLKHNNIAILSTYKFRGSFLSTWCIGKLKLMFGDRYFYLTPLWNQGAIDFFRRETLNCVNIFYNPSVIALEICDKDHTNFINQFYAY